MNAVVDKHLQVLLSSIRSRQSLLQMLKYRYYIHFPLACPDGNPFQKVRICRVHVSLSFFLFLKKQKYCYSNHILIFPGATGLLIQQVCVLVAEF